MEQERETMNAGTQITAAGKRRETDQELKRRVFGKLGGVPLKKKRRKDKPPARVRPERDRDVHAVLNAVRHMTAAEVARAAGVSAATVTSWRRLKTRWPQHYTLSQVAAAAGKRYVLVDVEDTDDSTNGA